MNASSEFRLKAEIDGRVSELVELGNDIIEKVAGKLGDIELNQIRNLVAVANSAPHPAIVINFIRYQMGRSATRAWKATGLGDEVIKVIEGPVRRMAKEADDSVGTDSVDHVQAQMTRLLLGFLNRSFVYQREAKK